MKRKGLSGAGVIAVFVLAAVGGVAVLGQMGVVDLSAVGGDDGDAPAGDDDSVASLYFKANDALDSSQPSYVNVSYEVVDGDGLIVAEGQTDTSSGFTQISDLDEETSYTVRMYDDDGSGSDYYFSEQTVTTNEGVKRFVQDVEKEGTVTTDVFETSGSSDDDDTLVISQGATEAFDIEVKENTQNAKFRQPAIALKTNDTDAVTELEVSGAQEVSSVPDRLSSYDDVYDVGTSEIVDFDTETYTVQVQRGENNGDSATVDAAIIDLAHYKNDQGEWLEGYEDDDDADVGAADATINTQTVN